MRGVGRQLEVDYKAVDISLLKRLLKYLKPYKKYVIIAVFLTLLTSSLAPVRPYLIKIAIDDYIGKGNDPGLIKIVIIIFGLLVLHAAIRFILTYLMQWVGQKVLYDIRVRLFEHIHKLSLRFHDNNPVGRLVTRVTNDVEVLNELFSSGVVMVIADILLIFWIIGFMLYINVQLALLTFTVLPFLILTSIIFRKKVRIIYREIRLKLAQINSFLNEVISGISTIKLFAREKSQASEFDHINEEYNGFLLRTILYYAVFFPIVEMLSAITLGIVLWYTADNILQGAMTIGTLIAFIQYAEMFFRPIRDLTEKYTTLQSSMAASERIFSLLDTEDFIDEKGNTGIDKFSGVLEFKNVSFSYDSSKEVLHDVSFSVRKGEKLAIVGATGSGKTTLINLLCRFYNLQEGTITIDGVDIRNIPEELLREKVAVVMQDVFIFSRPVGVNIGLGNGKIPDQRIIESAKALGAYDFISQLPDNMDTMLSERGSNLSSGQRQLLAFCRAYAADPDILILDEATSNIDSETERKIEKSLDILLKGRTSIIIAHRLSTIKRADNILVMHHGKAREFGTHEELMKAGGIYSRLYRLQFANGA